MGITHTPRGLNECISKIQKRKSRFQMQSVKMHFLNLSDVHSQNHSGIKHEREYYHFMCKETNCPRYISYSVRLLVLLFRAVRRSNLTD